MNSQAPEVKPLQLRTQLIAAAIAATGAWGFATLRLRAAGPYFIAGYFTWHLAGA